MTFGVEVERHALIRRDIPGIPSESRCHQLPLTHTLPFTSLCREHHVNLAQLPRAMYDQVVDHRASIVGVYTSVIIMIFTHTHTLLQRALLK